MPQAPLGTSITRTQVTPRIASPSIPTITSVTFSIMLFFWSAVKTPSIS